MKTFRQFLLEAGSFSYSTGSWRYYVMKDKHPVDKDGNHVTQKDAEKGKQVSFHEKRHEADRLASKVGGVVKRTRW